MDISYQVVDVLVALLLGLAVMVPLNLFAPGLGTVPGTIVATTYYFSRNPWGARDGAGINDRVDGLYDEYLPV